MALNVDDFLNCDEKLYPIGSPIEGSKFNAPRMEFNFNFDSNNYEKEPESPLNSFLLTISNESSGKGSSSDSGCNFSVTENLHGDVSLVEMFDIGLNYDKNNGETSINSSWNPTFEVKDNKIVFIEDGNSRNPILENKSNSDIDPIFGKFRDGINLLPDEIVKEKSLIDKICEEKFIKLAPAPVGKRRMRESTIKFINDNNISIAPKPKKKRKTPVQVDDEDTYERKKAFRQDI